MREKLVAFLSLGALLLSNAAFGSADSVTQSLGIMADIGGTVIMQRTPKANDGKNKGLSATSYLFDIKLTKKFEENGQVVVRGKGGRGTGLELDQTGNNGVNTYGQVNANEDQTLDSAANTLAKLVEFYYEQTILNDKLTVDFGKLNFWAFFADNNFAGDDNCQFLTGAFAGDKTIDSVPQRPALRLNYALFEKLDISYAYFTTDLDHFDASGINIAQFNFKPSTNGNYRLYVWGNNGIHYKYRDNPSKSGSYKDGAETQFEVYYKFTINNYIALTPAFQYFANPRGGNVLTGTSNADKNVLVYGIRTAFSF